MKQVTWSKASAFKNQQKKMSKHGLVLSSSLYREFMVHKQTYMFTKPN